MNIIVAWNRAVRNGVNGRGNQRNNRRQQGGQGYRERQAGQNRRGGQNGKGKRGGPRRNQRLNQKNPRGVVSQFKSKVLIVC